MPMKNLVAAAVIASGSLLAAGAHASVNLVQNGNFSQTSYTYNSQFGTGFGGQGVTDWTGNGGYNLFFFAGTATTVSASSQYDAGPGQGAEKLYGPSSGDLDPATSSNFVAIDGDPGVQGSISQTVTGLIAGKQYQLSFDWGAGQLQSKSGATTEQFEVSLGSQSFKTSVVNNPSKGFTGWFDQVFTFTATGTSELLDFLSLGTPSGLPPIATLDNISLTQVPVPEPMSLALLGAGLVGLGAVRRARRNKR